MHWQEIIEFLHDFNYYKSDLVKAQTHYSKFYTTYNRETPFPNLSKHSYQNGFVITHEMFCDNLVNEQFLLNHLRVLYEHHIAADERAALDDILNPKSSFYSEKNVLNKAFTKESLEEAITQVLFLIDNNGISNIKPKSLIVSPPMMFLAKKLFENGMIEYFPENLIVNPYIRSNTFAAIITDAQNSFRHFIRKPVTININDNKLRLLVEYSITSDRYFTLNNSQGIYVISF